MQDLGEDQFAATSVIRTGIPLCCADAPSGKVASDTDTSRIVRNTVGVSFMAAF